MKLYTASIFLPPLIEDGTRISVMSRHTFIDGVTPDNRIIPGESFHIWIPVVAPPAKLVGDHYKRGLPWNQFTERYLEYIRKPEIIPYVVLIKDMALKGTITLLCSERSSEECHRRLLAEECQRYSPDIQIKHR